MENKIKNTLNDYSQLDIKELLKLYLKNDERASEEFWNRYSVKIYNFPLKIYRADEDIAGDFFTYVFERLKDGSKFSTFDMEQNFDTWFYIVLRNFFFSMMRSRREIETVNVSGSDKDGNELFTIESFEDRTQTTFYQSIEEQEYIDTIDSLLEGIKLDYKIVIKLQLIYYYDLNNEEINDISKSSGKKRIEILQEIEEVRKELQEKSRTITQKETQIGKVYSIKRDLTRRLEWLKKTAKEGKNNDVEIAEIKRKLKKRQAQFEKLLEEKEKGMFIVKTPHKAIAKVLGVTENAVSIRTHRAEKAIRNKLEKEGLV